MEQQTQQPSENQTEEVKIEDPAAVLNALERAKAEAKKFREEKEKLEQELENTSQLAAGYSARLLQEKVKSSIEATGIKDPERFMKMVDFNKISLNETNDIVGFDDQLSVLKEEFPEVFDAKLRVGGQGDTAGATSINTKISATELQARKILGRI
jgi:hypothetical protein